jgi:hypothetical protein
MRRPHSLAALHSPRAHETPHRPGQRPREGSRLPRSAAGLRWARNHRTTADPPPTHALAPRWSHQARIRIARCTSTTSNSPSWTSPELTDSAPGRRIAATNQSRRSLRGPQKACQRVDFQQPSPDPAEVSLFDAFARVGGRGRSASRRLSGRLSYRRPHRPSSEGDQPLSKLRVDSLPRVGRHASAQPPPQTPAACTNRTIHGTPDTDAPQVLSDAGITVRRR